jgi:hypothetical protein
MLLRQKSEAEKTAKEIENINVSASKSSSKAQLDEYNKFIAEKDRATKKAINESIKTNDKASAAVMQSNLNYEKFNRQAMSDTLKARTALNQQRLKETNAINIQEQKFIERNAKLQATADAAALKSRIALNQQRLKETSQGSYFQKTIDLSKQVLAAAPGFAIAIAAVTTLYAVLRGLRDEFIRGLKAVEDYQVSVAEMAAFLTTFSDNLNSTDIAKIYGESRKEAEKLVQQMEILDARTVATGIDLNIMAEQFIKGELK